MCSVKVVFDTNILDGDRYLNRPRMRQVFAGAAAGDFEIVVPEAVVQEMVKHFPTDLTKVVDEVNKGLSKHYGRLNSLGLRGPAQLDVEIDDLVSEYEEALRSRLSEPGARIASVPDLS